MLNCVVGLYKDVNRKKGNTSAEVRRIISDEVSNVNVTHDDFFHSCFVLLQKLLSADTTFPVVLHDKIVPKHV